MSVTADLLDRYRAAWRENSAALLEACWDTSEPAPFYKAEELDRIITSWDELRAYWRHNETFNEKVVLQFADQVSVPVGERRELVGLRMRWDIRFAAGALTLEGRPFPWAGQAMGGENHVMALLRHAPGGPRLTAWVEAPNAAISYVAQLYLRNVSPGFAAGA